jgi:SOS-response transcriptional repressor LexA
MSPSPNAPSFTPKQGQYLAFIYAYTHVLGRPPAEADLQRHFGVSPPSVHQMVLILERTGLIRRKPGVARSIEVLVAPDPALTRSQLPKLTCGDTIIHGVDGEPDNTAISKIASRGVRICYDG